jgi:hypothetical protein
MRRNMNLSLIKRLNPMRLDRPSRAIGLFQMERTGDVLTRVGSCAADTGKKKAKTNSGVKGVELGARSRTVCAMTIKLPVTIIASGMVNEEEDGEWEKKGEPEVPTF